jgi:hypothetical protein
MAKANDFEYRVPLTECLGYADWMTAEAKASWLRENRIEIREDWAGRESVDLATAYRLKDMYDKANEKAQQQQNALGAHQAAVRHAQIAREEKLGTILGKLNGSRLGQPFLENLAIARAQVIAEEAETLPREIRKELHWPLNTPIIWT